jgi:hypothetical protein
MEDRLNDLVSRVDLSITGAQLTARESPSVASLGLPSYYWGKGVPRWLRDSRWLA